MNTREPRSTRAWRRLSALSILSAAATLAPSHPALAQRYDIFLCEPAPEYYIVEVNGINNHGRMVGTAYRFGTFGELGVFWRETGELVELPNLYPPKTVARQRVFELAQAHGINDAGWMVGRADTLQRGDQAVMWSDEGTIDTLTDRDSVAKSVNDNGVIIGNYHPGGAFT